MLAFRVLGPLEVCSGGRPIALPDLASRGVLAALVLRPGAWVSTDRLIDELETLRHSVICRREHGTSFGNPYQSDPMGWERTFGSTATLEAPPGWIRTNDLPD